MSDDPLFHTLRQLGFSEYEAKCYLALFNKNSMAVSEVARISGVPRPNAYDALEKLMNNGFIMAVPGRTKRFSATDPNTIKDKSFEPIVNTLNFEIESLERKLREKNSAKNSLEKNIDSTLKQLENRYQRSRNSNNPLDYISVLRDNHQIHRKFVELFSKAEKEVLIFCKPPFAYSSEKERQEQYQVQCKAAERGVVVRGIVEMPPEDQVQEFFEKQSGKTPTNQDDETRVIDKLPIKLNIYDNKTCFFTLVDPIKERTSLTMLVAEHEALILSFRMLFESIWEKAKDYYVYKGKKYYRNEYTDDYELRS